jgi:predicted NBD/HSP70 family sugar kinase
MAEPKTRAIFGLSVADRIEWAHANATATEIVFPIHERGVFAGIPSGNLGSDNREPLVIQRALRFHLERLVEARPELKSVDAIGVSTIGVANNRTMQLEQIDRKPWRPAEAGKAPIDFLELFSGLFKTDRVYVTNDAPARAINEFLHGRHRNEEIERLFAIYVGEGINGALVVKSNDSERAFLRYDGHPEIGHIFPRLHLRDHAFDAQTHSGCPRHGYCYEGLMTNGRFRQEFGSVLTDLPGGHIAWDIAAHYCAHIAHSATLMTVPDRILFGGPIFAGKPGLELIDDIRTKFLNMLDGYIPRYSTPEAISKLIDRASFGDSDNLLASLTLGRLQAYDNFDGTPIGERSPRDTVIVEFDPSKRGVR